MTDQPSNSPQQDQQAAPSPRPYAPYATPFPSQPQKSNKKTWLIVGILAALFCLCSTLCVVVFGTSLYGVFTEKAPIEEILNAYMRYMANQDPESAYALFSPRAQRQIPLSEVQELLEGNNYIIFEGFQSLTVSNLNLSAVANTDPDVPQGSVATATGVITFNDGIQGSFTGVLEKVGDEWMIAGMHVTVPPSKFK